MKILCGIICFLFPIKISFWLLNLFGHKVSASAKVGFSFLLIDGKISLGAAAVIGHFNIIKLNSIELEKKARIGKFNKIEGPLDLVMKESGAIGNRNRIYRGPIGITYGNAILQIGKISKITVAHRVDCTRSVFIGDYSILAGHDSQIWTHAYVHDKSGPGRFRVDGEVKIGNNVYIGSQCVINSGIKIVDTVVVGANASVSKSLIVPGTYVNQALRFLPFSEDDKRKKYKKIIGSDLCEDVYEKKIEDE